MARRTCVPLWKSFPWLGPVSKRNPGGHECRAEHCRSDINSGTSVAIGDVAHTADFIVQNTCPRSTLNDGDILRHLVGIQANCVEECCLDLHTDDLLRLRILHYEVVEAWGLKAGNVYRHG